MAQTQEPDFMSLLQNSVSFAEAMQFLALRAAKHAFSAVALTKLMFCKSFLCDPGGTGRE